MKNWLMQFILAAARRLGTDPIPGEAPSYSNEHIECCARLYRDNPALRQRGVLFSTFVAFPEECMLAAAGGMAVPLPAGEEYYPLLPDQLAVRARLDRDDDDRHIQAQINDVDRLLATKRMRISNGALMEPMHHKAYPRRQQKRIAVEISAS